jgi:lysyl-tRNA synthetase class 2
MGARASLCQDDSRGADRFEFFIGPLELANGYHELTDAGEQRARFERDLARRREAGLPVPPPDERLLAALEAGMPDASGVALGLDRLLMSLSGVSSISDVMAFPADLA